MEWKEQKALAGYASHRAANSQFIKDEARAWAFAGAKQLKKVETDVFNLREFLFSLAIASRIFFSFSVVLWTSNCKGNIVANMKEVSFYIKQILSSFISFSKIIHDVLDRFL